jgi:hypothetical protein
LEKATALVGIVGMAWDRTHPSWVCGAIENSHFTNRRVIMGAKYDPTHQNLIFFHVDFHKNLQYLYPKL